MTETAERGRGGEWKYLILLSLGALFAYWNSFGGMYYLDDHVWIVKNPKIGDPFSFFLGWRVLVSLSLTFNYWIDGVNPRGYHAFNLAIHVLAGLTLYGVIRRTLLSPRWGERLRQRASVIAFVIALLWLIHPLNTQAVTYVIQRCESMVGLFYLLTLYCVLRGATGRRPRTWYVAAVLCCCAGLLCKEVMMTAPVVVLIYDWVFLSPSAGQLVRRRGGLYGAFVLGALAYMGYIASTGLLTSRTTAVSFNYTGFGPLEYALTQTGVILYYVRLSIWPSPLCMDYLDWPIARSLSECWLSATAIGVLGIAAVVGVARRHWLGFLGAWFLLILAPSSSFMPIQDPVFEYRMYLSLAAVLALGVAVFYSLLDHAAARGAVSPALFRGAAVALVCLWGLILSGLTMARNAQYGDFAAMSQDIVAKRPTNYRALETLAQVEMVEGKTEEALDHLRRAVLVKPAYFLAYNTAGICFIRQNRLKEAVVMFQTAVDLKPGFQPDVYPANLGRAFLLSGDAAAAVAALDDAVRRNPSIGRYHALRAAALEEAGRTEETVVEYEAAVSLDLGLPGVLNREARAVIFDPKCSPALLQEAVLMSRAACRMTDDRTPDYLDTLAEGYAASGRFDEARETCRKAIERAEAQGDGELADQLRGRLRLYQSGRPYNQQTVS